MNLFQWILTLSILQCIPNAAVQTIKGPRLKRSTHKLPVNHKSRHPSTSESRSHKSSNERIVRKSPGDIAASELLHLFKVMGPGLPEKDYEVSRTTPDPPATRWRGVYVSPASWKTPYALGSSNEWRSMHKNVNKEYAHEWYEFIYSTEESNPYYSYSYKRTSCFWKKIRNTRATPEPYDVWKTELLRNRSRFQKRKRAKAHEEWKARNLPMRLQDEDYERHLRKVLYPDEAIVNRTRDQRIAHQDRDQRIVEGGRDHRNGKDRVPNLSEDDSNSGDAQLKDVNLDGLELFWTRNLGSANSSEEDLC